MSTLYWINVLDNINFLFVFIFMVSLILSVACVLVNLAWTTDEISETLDYKRFTKTKHFSYTLLIY